METPIQDAMRNLPPARLISEHDFIKAEADQNGEALPYTWAQKGKIYFYWIPLVHQMSIRELIDFMKEHIIGETDVKRRTKMYGSDDYWLSRLTPLQLLYEAQRAMDYSSSSDSSGQSRPDTAETTNIRPAEPPA